MAKAKKVLLVVHPKFRPDRKKAQKGTEKDVWHALRRLGYQTLIADAEEDLRLFDKMLAKFRPSIVVNLLEEFRGEAVYDFHLISFLEALGVPYTGCNPRGLIQSRNKFVVGQLAQSVGVAAPRSLLLTPSKRIGEPSQLKFPLFVKLNREHASMGIRESNRVRNGKELDKVCRRLRRDYNSEIVVQEFISGRDVSVALWGNARAEVFAPRTLHMGGVDRVSTERLKFNVAYQRQRAVKSVQFKGAITDRLQREAQQLFQLLDLSGYARFDYRVDQNGEPYLIDVNANPNLANNEDFAISARLAGWKYPEVVEQVVKLGLSYSPRL